MIAKMDKVTVVCLEEDKTQTLKRLGELGILHIVPAVQPVSDELTTLHQEATDLERTITRLKTFPLDKQHKEPLPPIAPDTAAEPLLHEIQADFNRMADAQATLQQLKAQLAQIEPWGDFDWNVLDALEAQGWHVALCTAAAGHLPDFPEGCFHAVVGKLNKTVYFAAFSKEPMDFLDSFSAQLPHGVTRISLVNRIALTAAEEYDAYDKLAAAARNGSIAILEAKLARLRKKTDFCNAYYGMGRELGTLAFLQGYVPESQVDALRNEAAECGWAISYDEVEQDDHQVPTELIVPKAFRMAQQIFDFVGVLPGYTEADVSVSVFVFLSIFCGILVGDAGYGALFMLLTGWLWAKAKDDHARDGFKLLFVMSTCTLVWGALSGNWFGLPPNPDARGIMKLFGGLKWLSQDSTGDHVKFLCFFIGALHLSIARIWKAAISSTITQRLGNIGWALFLWANFYTVRALIIGGTFGLLPKLMYAIGTVLILAFSINWKDIGDVFYMPFQFINSMVDVMSYIRLYAVGLSSLYIAQSFNGMSTSIWQISPYLVPAGLLVILIGHALNVALACMGVMVHGIRLNTLEFSNHIGLEWGGRPYRPFTN